MALEGYILTQKAYDVLMGIPMQIYQKYDMNAMILFGSQVREETDKNSNVDLIVVGDEFKDKT